MGFWSDIENIFKSVWLLKKNNFLLFVKYIFYIYTLILKEKKLWVSGRFIHGQN